MPETQRPKFFKGSATNPGTLQLSNERLHRLRPDLYEIPRWQRPFVALMHGGQRTADRQRYAEQLQFGDARAAVVVSTEPLLVAAYTDELDCVAMLRFENALAEEYGLSIGRHLLTVNAYQIHVPGQKDLLPGPANSQRYNAMYPLIADFLTDDQRALEERKTTVNESEWQRAAVLGREYLRAKPGVHRDGRPGYNHKPASLLSKG